MFLVPWVRIQYSAAEMYFRLGVDGPFAAVCKPLKHSCTNKLKLDLLGEQNVAKKK